MMLKTCNKCKVDKSLSSFRKDKYKKDGLSTICKQCKTDYDKSYKPDPEKKKANQSRYYWNNREKVLEINSEYRNKNADLCRERVNNWRQRNKPVRAAQEAYRRSYRLKATPEWADLELIELIYTACEEGFHVDHIVPLKGKNVCGLHVENNLQYLPARENIRKSNIWRIT